jgi:thiamine-phosphate pyrophosphorylase
MRFGAHPPRVMLVTDPAFADEQTERCVAAVAAALPPGAFVVQLRDKERAEGSLRLFAWQLRVVTRAHGAWLVVNGRPELARDVGAEGVHLGGGVGTAAHARRVLTRPSWISMAAHSDQDVARARAEGADAVLVSPVFSTESRTPDGDRKAPRGLDCLRTARRVAGPDLQIYALGGVTAASARACSASGADGVAVRRALLSAPDPRREARAIHDVWAHG